jgi:hypothetical protein
MLQLPTPSLQVPAAPDASYYKSLVNPDAIEPTDEQRCVVRVPPMYQVSGSDSSRTIRGYDMYASIYNREHVQTKRCVCV